MAVYISISLCAQADYSAGYIYAHPLFRMIDFMIGILLYKAYRSEKGKKLANKITNPTSFWHKPIGYGSGIAVYRNVFPINPLQSEHSLCHYLLDTISHNRVLFYSKRSR